MSKREENREAVRNLVKAQTEEKKDSKTINVTLTMPENVKDDLRKVCWIRRTTMSKVLTDFARKYIEENADALDEFNIIGGE